MKGSHQKTAIILLAAGSSSRMGAIKQLLPWKQTTLIGHAIEQALFSEAEEVYVVLGANNELISKEINKENVIILINKNWALGMGTSISCAMDFILNSDVDYGTVLITLVDQPLVDIKYINKLIYNSIHNNIIASKHQDKAGVPTIFSAKYFSELKNLNGNIGARELIATHKGQVKILDVLEKVQDIDNMETYKILYQKYGK